MGLLEKCFGTMPLSTRSLASSFIRPIPYGDGRPIFAASSSLYLRTSNVGSTLTGARMADSVSSLIFPPFAFVAKCESYQSASGHALDSCFFSLLRAGFHSACAGRMYHRDLM